MTKGPPSQFFSAIETFFRKFLSSKGPPFNFLMHGDRKDVEKNPKDPPLSFFRHYYTCDKQVLWESASFFSARQLVSDRKSHNSDFFGLAVRCLLFNPEGPGSNPCLCANFFTKISKQKILTFFDNMRLPLPPFRLFETYFRKFFNVPKGSPLHFFDILQQNER